MKCCSVFRGGGSLYEIQSYSPLNFHCLEKMFTNSNYFENYSFHTAESDFSYQVYQLNYCYYYILKNCVTRDRVFEVLKCT